MEELHVLIRKIVAWKPNFREEANEALKYQFTHHLGDSHKKLIN